MSASFASLVSAIESLTARGESHHFDCPQCGKPTHHEVPGATRQFKEFFDTYAPDLSQAKSRAKMYSLRSGILHGGELMQLDQEIAHGWDPPSEDERTLHDELWALTRIALRNWLKNPPDAPKPKQERTTTAMATEHELNAHIDALSEEEFREPDTHRPGTR